MYFLLCSDITSQVLRNSLYIAQCASVGNKYLLCCSLQALSSANTSRRSLTSGSSRSYVCSGIWMGRSRWVKLDLVGAVYEMEERKNEREGIREEARKQNRIDMTVVVCVCK